jgi:drug/metabolite transporter (DMT)-like permease
MTPYEWALLTALSIVWGGTFLFQEIAVREVPTLTIVLFRVALAAAILLCICIIKRVRLPSSRRIWIALFGLAIVNNVIPFCLIVWGQTQIASGLAAILNATTPLFAVLVAHVITADEKINGRKLVGVIAGVLGVAIMIGGDALSIGVGIAGQLAVLGAAFAYALGGILGRRFTELGLSPLAISTGQLMASTVILLPIAFLADRPWTLPLPSTETIAAIVCLAALSTALAYLLYFRILATAGATNLMLVTLLIPVTAIAAGIVLLGEDLYLRHIIGLFCIALGLAAIDGRLLRRP